MSYDYFDFFDSLYYGNSPGYFPNFLISVLITILTIVIIVAVALYLLNAFGLFKIAKRLNVENTWLSFIPIANAYVLGRIGEEVTAKYEHNPKKYAIILLCLSVASVVMGIIATTFSLNILTASAFGGFINPFTVITSGMAICIIGVIISVVYAVFFYIALYKLYKFLSSSCVLFLVLSILFGLAPFFVFFLRNSTNKEFVGGNGGGQPNGQFYQQPMGQPNGQFYQQQGQPMGQPTAQPMGQPTEQPPTAQPQGQPTEQPVSNGEEISPEGVAQNTQPPQTTNENKELI